MARLASGIQMDLQRSLLPCEKTRSKKSKLSWLLNRVPRYVSLPEKFGKKTETGLHDAARVAKEID